MGIWYDKRIILVRKNKGVTTSKAFTVVKKGTFSKVAGVAELTKAAQKLPLKLPSEITTKNGVKYVFFSFNG